MSSKIGEEIILHVPFHHSIIPRYAILILLFSHLFVASSVYTAEYRFAKINSSSLPVIVLDPGHGGYETGVIGVEGTAEKNITLKFAQILKNQIVGEYGCILTRSDDLALSLSERSATANHSKANLLISIHANGDLSRKENEFGIYFYSATAATHPTNDTENAKSLKTDPPLTLWDGQQQKYIASSASLADSVRMSIKNKFPSKTIILKGMPLMALSSIDMPSIVIEIGNLTNPIEENRLHDTGYLERIADAVKSGIISFLHSKEK